MPAVSVVMTSYNYRGFIADAIRSVLDQSFTDLELIVVDDASKDGSQEIIKRFEEEDSRVRTAFHEKNLGISRSVNHGWELARGEFIANISSDDLWVSKKLETQMEVLDENGDLVVWSEGEIIDAHGRPNGDLFTRFHGAAHRRKSGNIFDELLEGNFVLASSRIFKKKNLNGRGYYTGMKYLSDYRFAVDMASEYDYYFIEDPLVKYRIHGENTFSRDKKGYLRDEAPLLRYFFLKYGNRISNRRKARLLLDSAICEVRAMTS